MNPKPAPRKEPEDTSNIIMQFLRNAIEKLFVHQMKESKVKQEGQVSCWWNKTTKDVKRKVYELDYKDLGNDIWSDSDASEQREEETQIALDNSVMT